MTDLDISPEELADTLEHSLTPITGMGAADNVLDELIRDNADTQTTYYSDCVDIVRERGMHPDASPTSDVQTLIVETAYLHLVGDGEEDRRSLMQGALEVLADRNYGHESIANVDSWQIDEDTLVSVLSSPSSDIEFLEDMRTGGWLIAWYGDYSGVNAGTYYTYGHALDGPRFGQITIDANGDVVA